MEPLYEKIFCINKEKELEVLSKLKNLNIKVRRIGIDPIYITLVNKDEILTLIYLYPDIFNLIDNEIIATIPKIN